MIKTEKVLKRIEELRQIQAEEEKNNFKNGELWNDSDDEIWRLETYGQSNPPKDFYDANGYVAGYILEDGTIFYHSGMSIYDSHQY